MKTQSIFLLLLLAATATAAQTIRRVNNNPGVTGVNVYSTPQAAHDAAAPNDILLIEPSGTSYGQIVLTKPLKIYGNGYFLSADQRIDTRASGLSDVYFNTGSGGSEIYGVIATIHTRGVSNIVISRNSLNDLNIRTDNIAGTTNTNVSNILVTRNFMYGMNGSPTGGSTISNVNVSNNIISSSISAGGASIQNWIVRNNTFTYTSFGTLVNLHNSVFENNLIARSAPNFSLNLNNTSYSYNISNTLSFGGGVGNVDNYDVVTDLEKIGSASEDKYYQIKSTSSLKTAGSGGIEVGAFGGDTPYILSGLPAMPAILNMTNTATGSDTHPLEVTISVKSNN